MIYFIERETSIPFDGSITECKVNGKTYDILKQNKNTGLDSISEHIIDDSKLGMIFSKTNPRETKQIEKFVEEKWGPMQELLLG